jgi:DNA polymerase-3 subunit delta
MITTYTGENSFTLSRALREYIEAFERSHGNLTIERIDGEDTEYDTIQRSLTSLPFLAAKQLVILRMPSKNKQFMEQFEQLFGQIPDSTDVIIVEPKVDKRLNYFKYLKKQTNFIEFPELDEQALSSWLVDSVKERDGVLNRNDARYLVDRVGSHQQLLDQEVQKLLLFKPNITRESIDLLTEPVPQSSIFELLEAAFNGQTQKAAALYDEQRVQKVEPQQIIAMLSWQLHILAVIKTAGDRTVDQVAQESKLSPYVIRKSQDIARRLSLAELKKMIAELVSIDSKMKRTLINADDALQNYLLSIKV